MTEPTDLPPVDEYPGYFAKKPPLLRRKRVQVVSAGVGGVLVGLMLGGSGSAATPPAITGIPEAEVQARINEAVTEAREEAENEAAQAQPAAATEELADLQEDLSSTEQALRDTRQEIRDVKKAAKRAQRKAVAAAVKRTKTRMRQETQAEPPVTTSTGGGSSTDPRFNYCYEANDAGYGNYQSGVDPEYDWYDDADNDGWVCES